VRYAVSWAVMGRPGAVLAAWIVGPTLIASPFGIAAAKPNEGRECIIAHETGQSARRTGRLRQARVHFVACASETCPSDVRKECSGQLDDIDARLPSIVVEARDQAAAVAEARVFMDGALLADKLSGLALSVDPGPHTLRVECNGGRISERPLMLNEGDKLHRVTVDCSTPTSPAAAPTAPGAREAGAPPIPMAAWVLGGVALAALGTFGTFAVLGRAKESSLTDSCAPTCHERDVAPVERQYLIADVSLIVAALSSAGALAVLFWPRAPATSAKHVRFMGPAPGLRF
jgi:hypothetical protein